MEKEDEHYRGYRQSSQGRASCEFWLSPGDWIDDQMTSTQFRAAIAKLGLSQQAAGKFFGRTGRQGQRWANGDPIPESVAKLLWLMIYFNLKPGDVNEIVEYLAVLAAHRSRSTLEELKKHKDEIIEGAISMLDQAGFLKHPPGKIKTKRKSEDMK